MELLQNLTKDNGENNMEQAVEESYNVTLKSWHGWISSAAFKVIHYIEFFVIYRYLMNIIEKDILHLPFFFSKNVR